MKANVHIKVTEKLIQGTNADSAVFGIGINSEKGELFWFRRELENQE